jgi:hypothetical protein
MLVTCARKRRAMARAWYAMAWPATMLAPVATTDLRVAIYRAPWVAHPEEM